MTSDIKQSQTYIWSTKDVLGKGATSVVYRGIDRNTGALVAVKTFNNFYSPREFDVLKKTNHENIVKLLAIETEVQHRPISNKPQRQILVTELCSGGCLNDILDDPENIYGLNDSEFLRVLSHLCAGMKYLRDNDIIHRDLKPGNIMKFIKDDGTSIYKLIDFGAARELSDDKDFKSLYGTEEYLCPDMYERAVLGVHAGKTFQATVDLWSIGVTLYHVATGDLPFRPFGGRKNRATMYQITATKESGIISGVQFRQNGPIEWRSELPDNCLLSAGLKKIITPLIAGLLESENSKIWSFGKFFSEVSLILSRKVVNIFHANKSALLKVYLMPDENNQRQLREKILAQTALPAENQILLYKNSLISDTDDIFLTSEDNPLFLFSTADNKVGIPLLQVFSQTIAFTKPIDVSQDSREAKNVCCDGYQVKRYIEQFALYSKLICDAVENMSNCVKKAFDKTHQNTQHLVDKTKMLQRMADILEISQDISNYHIKSKRAEELNHLSKCFNNDIAPRVLNLHKKHVDEDYLNTQWNKVSKDLKIPFYTRCTIRATIQVNKLRDSMIHMRKGRDCPMSQIDQYMLERKKMRIALRCLINLLENEVFPQYSILINNFEEWYEIALTDFLKTEILSNNVIEYQVNLEEFEEKLMIDNNQYKEHLKLKGNPNKTVMKPTSGDMNKKLKNQLKTYICTTESLNNIIEENKTLRNILGEYTSGLNNDIFSLEE